jgi:hypothetical protein
MSKISNKEIVERLEYIYKNCLLNIEPYAEAPYMEAIECAAEIVGRVDRGELVEVMKVPYIDYDEIKKSMF